MGTSSAKEVGGPAELSCVGYDGLAVDVLESAVVNVASPDVPVGTACICDRCAGWYLWNVGFIELLWMSGCEVYCGAVGVRYVCVGFSVRWWVVVVGYSCWDLVVGLVWWVMAFYLVYDWLVFPDWGSLRFCCWFGLW